QPRIAHRPWRTYSACLRCHARSGARETFGSTPRRQPLFTPPARTRSVSGERRGSTGVRLTRSVSCLRVSQDYVELSVAGKTFRGRILDDRSPSAARALRARLPLDASLVLDEWSGFIARIRLSIPLVTTGGDPIVAFAHPGLVMLDPANGDLAICFGQGRLQNGLGPIPALPLIE